MAQADRRAGYDDQMKRIGKRAKHDAASARKDARDEWAHGPAHRQEHFTLSHPHSHTSTTHTHDALTDSDKRVMPSVRKLVVDSLAGKVKCSGCGTGFFGTQYKTLPGIRVTRYIGYNMPKLTVDLVCLGCEHTGLYKFDGNPLIDAGFVELAPTEDIPF